VVVDARLPALAIHSPREVAEPQGALSPRGPAQLAWRKVPVSRGAFLTRDVAQLSSWLAARYVSYLSYLIHLSQMRRYLRVSSESRVSERLAYSSALVASLADHPKIALLEEVAQNSAHCRLG
jgi:hypothetical protein